MTHIVAGYPTLKTSQLIAEEMIKSGVNFIEIQIPFSDPIADGPVIMAANQKALQNKVGVPEALELMRRLKAKTIGQQEPVHLLFMCYFNTIFRFGASRFCREAKRAGAYGLIVPDLPPEEGKEYLKICKKYDLNHIFVLAPTSTKKRMRKIARKARGFVYLMARTGITGQQTRFKQEFFDYLKEVRKYIKLPLAVGFGIKSKSQLDFLKNKVEMAVIGSGVLATVGDKKGKDAVKKVRRFLERVR